VGARRGLDGNLRSLERSRTTAVVSGEPNKRTVSLVSGPRFEPVAAPASVSDKREIYEHVSDRDRSSGALRSPLSRLVYNALQ
jgi:hypothetical protein